MFYHLRKYRRKYKDQKHLAEEVISIDINFLLFFFSLSFGLLQSSLSKLFLSELEEDLIIEEAGIGAFFERRGNL